MIGARIEVIQRQPGMWCWYLMSGNNKAICKSTDYFMTKQGALNSGRNAIWWIGPEAASNNSYYEYDDGKLTKLKTKPH